MVKNNIFQMDFVSTITRKIDIESVLQQIVPVGKLSKSQVLDVYRGDYVARLTGALGENFEALWAVLGDKEFFKLCKLYLEAHPSQASDLGEVGHHLPTFLKANGYEESYPFILDLVNFEIEFWKTFHSMKNSQDSLVKPSLENLIHAKINFRDDLKLFNWNFKIKDIWSYREKGFASVTDDFNQEQSILMFRNENNVMLLELLSSQMKLIKNLKEGKSLSEALEDVEIEVDEIQQLFSQLELHGLIKNYKLS
jgi:hypothetical protein